MTTRGLSRKKVIIPMAKHIAELIINSAHTHITNVNKCLKNSKLDIVANFICITNNGIVITCYIQVHLSGKLYLCGDATSEPYKPTFLTTRLMAVLQPSGYSVFHDGVNPVSVSTLKLPLRVIGVVTTETPSISYTFYLYIRLVVTL